MKRLSAIVLAIVTASCGGPSVEEPTDVHQVSWSGVGPQDNDATAALYLEPVTISELRDLLLSSDASELDVALHEGIFSTLEGRYSRSFDQMSLVLAASPESVQGAVAAYLLSALTDRVPYSVDRAREAVEAVQGKPMSTLTAVFLAKICATMAVFEYQQSADENDAPFDGSQWGLPPVWRILGPIARYPHYDFDRASLAQADFRLGDEYFRDGFDLETRLYYPSNDLVGRFPPGGGLHLAETWLHLDAPIERLLIVDTNDDVLVELDGQEVLRRTNTGDYQATVSVTPIRFGPGWHRIRVRFGFDDQDAAFRLQLASPEAIPTSLEFAAEPPADAVMGEIRTLASGQLRTLDMLPAGVLETSSVTLIHHGLRLAQGLGDPATTMALVDRLEEQESLSPLALTALSLPEAQLESPNGAANRRVNMLQRVLDIDPEIHHASLALAAAYLLSDQENEAMALVRSADESLPDELNMSVARFQMLDYLALPELAEDELEWALQLDPENCSVVDWLSQQYVTREYYPDVDQLPEGFRTCQSGVRYQVDQALVNGDAERALELLRRLRSRQPHDAQLFHKFVSVLVAQGHTSEAREQLEEADAWTLTPSERTLLLADMHLAEDRQAQALNILGGDEPPEDVQSNRQLAAVQAMLSGSALLSDLRIDTYEAISNYNARQLPTSSGIIYALDYGAYRFFENGRGVSLTHQILHILSREALGSQGEVSIPGGAIPLRIATIKPDGTILTPEQSLGRETISMPNLEVGDFIEVEYMEYLSVSETVQGMFRLPRFYFQVFDAPLAISMLVLQVPESWPEIQLDSRAGAPVPEINVADGRRSYYFTAEEVVPPVQEYNAPPFSEVLPSVRPSNHATWEHIAAAFSDSALRVVRPTGAIARKVAELTEGIDSEREQIRAIFQYVVEDIEETGGFLSTDAVWTLRQDEGERLPLLLALLESAGFPNELLFARSWANDNTPNAAPDADDYPFTLVRVWLSDGDVIWLEAVDNAEFDFIPPAIQGNTGIVVLSDRSSVGTQVQLPVWPVETNTQVIDLDLQIDEAGNLVGHATELVPLSNAGYLREALSMVDDDRVIIQELERGMSSSFQGVSVTGFDISDSDVPEQPLQVSYDFQAQGFARQDQGVLVVDTRIFDRGLLSAYASAPTRQYPIMISEPLHEVMTVHWHFPAGWEIEQLPENRSFSSFGINVTWQASAGTDGEQLVLSRSTDIPVGRIPASEYQALREYLTEIDNVEAIRLRAQAR
ncbi:MAG: hypothetical protein KC561_00335 [Myxococcales bacterium]|nr:hypothetical protein [Myxococcales bacterium]